MTARLVMNFFLINYFFFEFHFIVVDNHILCACGTGQSIESSEFYFSKRIEVYTGCTSIFDGRLALCND